MDGPENLCGPEQKSLAIAENQHRLSTVRQTETGLTRPHAIAFIRRILLEVEKRYRVRGDSQQEVVHQGLIEWTRAVVGEYNITLARDYDYQRCGIGNMRWNFGDLHLG